MVRSRFSTSPSGPAMMTLLPSGPATTLTTWFIFGGRSLEAMASTLAAVAYLRGTNAARRSSLEPPVG